MKPARSVGISRFLALVLLGFVGSAQAQVQVQAQGDGSALESCLQAWGDNHPFGSRPVYRTLATSVKVFGRGPSTSDTEVTDTPALILINPGVNVMGHSEIALLNPNGWYCLRAAVNVMGGMDIKLHCRARLASATGGTTVWGGDNAAKGVTVMGAITVERVGCPDT